MLLPCEPYPRRFATIEDIDHSLAKPTPSIKFFYKSPSTDQILPPSNVPSIKSSLFETFLSIVPFCGVGFAIPLRIFHSTIPPKSSILPTLRPHHPCPP